MLFRFVLAFSKLCSNTEIFLKNGVMYGFSQVKPGYRSQKISKIVVLSGVLAILPLPLSLQTFFTTFTTL